MSKRARRGGGSLSPIIGVLLLIAIAAAVWFVLQRRAPTAVAPTSTSAPTTVSAERVDAGNEGRTLYVSGDLHAAKPARDAQLGTSADANAIALLRRVEMLQWREKCAATACDYALAWSEQPIDSSKFRERKGHENAARFPFTSARFLADDLRLGAFKLDAALVARVVDASESIAYPVHTAQLPPNLAATFRERDGVLYAGADPDHAASGDLRVGYRVIAGGEQRVTGVQVGDRLKAPPAH